MMSTNVTSHASTSSCMKRSWMITFVGLPLFLSTTAICMYRSNPKSTKTLVRYRYSEWNRATGYGPVALLGMPAIVGNVVDVVETIDARRGKAEGEKRHEPLRERANVEERATEDYRGEDEEVFYPLHGAEQERQRLGMSHCVHFVCESMIFLAIQSTILLSTHANGSVATTQARNVGQ